ncbi:hypothetical protein SDC9_167285 [bioreactor metagenome]|uniref:Uncharacterized protein n=1 Tax=bioreactor metagenome TaxID=1076179 RepID=A0A645G1Z0_9ZZZZ
MRPMTTMCQQPESGSLAGLLDQTGNGRRQLGAVLLPEGQALGVDHQALLGARGDRVVEANALDEAAVTTVTRIGSNDVVERALFGATTGKANDDHLSILRSVKTKSGRV